MNFVKYFTKFNLMIKRSQSVRNILVLKYSMGIILSKVFNQSHEKELFIPPALNIENIEIYVSKSEMKIHQDIKEYNQLFFDLSNFKNVDNISLIDLQDFAFLIMCDITTSNFKKTFHNQNFKSISDDILSTLSIKNDKISDIIYCIFKKILYIHLNCDKFKSVYSIIFKRNNSFEAIEFMLSSQRNNNNIFCEYSFLLCNKLILSEK